MPAPKGSISQTKLNVVLAVSGSDLTISEIAEKLGVSVDVACALVVAAMRCNLAEAQPPHLPFP